MSVTTSTTQIPLASRSEIPEKTLLAGLALTSFSALLLALSLRRLFFVVLFYHFAFLVVSLALLVLGAGVAPPYVRKTLSSGIYIHWLAALLVLSLSTIV